MSSLIRNDSNNVHQAQSTYAFGIIHKRHIKSKRNVDWILLQIAYSLSHSLTSYLYTFSAQKSTPLWIYRLESIKTEIKKQHRINNDNNWKCALLSNAHMLISVYTSIVLMIVEQQTMQAVHWHSGYISVLSIRFSQDYYYVNENKIKRKKEKRSKQLSEKWLP